VIRVNLLPIEERVDRSRPALQVPRRGFWLSLALGAAILAPIVGIGVMQRVKIMNLQDDVARAEEEAQRLKPQIERIRALTKERQELSQRLVTVQGLARDRYLPVQIMDELATQTPDYLWFTKFENKSTGELELEGMTFSNVLVAELMTRMEEADIFRDVSLAVSERAKVGDGKVVRFSLVTKIKP
jgi:type IV pilus assembly protein PilN